MSSNLYTTETRQHLYYNRYRWRGSVTLNGLGYTRTARTYDEALATHFRIKDSTRNQYSNFRIQFPDDTELDLLAEYYAWKAANPNIKLRLEWNTVSAFSNEAAPLSDMAIFSPTGTVAITQAVPLVTDDSNTIVLVEPQHSHRVYLRSRRVSDQDIDSLKLFFARFPDTFYPSMSLSRWLDRTGAWPSPWCRSSFFFEFDSEPSLMTFQLTFGELVGRVYKVVKR